LERRTKRQTILSEKAKTKLAVGEIKAVGGKVLRELRAIRETDFTEK